MNPILGIIFHAIGGVAAGSFYAPCKRIKGWAWETYWLTLGVFAWVATPLLMAVVIMPNFIEVFTAVPPKVVFWAYFFGLLWGIGGLSFGLTMRYLGISLGVSVALGFCAMFGMLIPRSAQMVAEFLQSHRSVARVRYGGLSSWNRYLKSGSLKGFGGMLGIEWKKNSVHRNLGKYVKLIINATSLGDPVTRILERGEEKDRGIPARYTRVSIGLEDPQDLIADFKQAIKRCS